MKENRSETFINQEKETGNRKKEDGLKEKEKRGENKQVGQLRETCNRIGDCSSESVDFKRAVCEELRRTIKQNEWIE